MAATRSTHKRLMETLQSVAEEWTVKVFRNQPRVQSDSVKYTPPEPFKKLHSYYTYDRKYANWSVYDDGVNILGWSESGHYFFTQFSDVTYRYSMGLSGKFIGSEDDPVAAIMRRVKGQNDHSSYKSPDSVYLRIPGESGTGAGESLTDVIEYILKHTHEGQSEIKRKDALGEVRSQSYRLNSVAKHRDQITHEFEEGMVRVCSVVDEDTAQELWEAGVLSVPSRERLDRANQDYVNERARLAAFVKAALEAGNDHGDLLEVTYFPEDIFAELHTSV